MSSYREINDKGKSKQDHRRRGHNYIKRITRIDPVTGEIEQQCSRCGEWWFQDKEFWWYFNGEPAPTCKACHAEARERNKAPQQLPARKPIQAKKAKRHTTPKKRPDGYWQRKRAGITCSSLSFEALGQLIEAEGQGWPFIPLSNVHPHTINALQHQNWIISSDGLDGIRYRITSEGKRVHRLFSKPPKRTDGICPTCGVRPKHRYPSGLLYGYCLECENKSKRRNYALGRQRINPDRLCSACHERPLHRMSGGKLSTYCTECRHAKRAAEKRAQHDRDLARIRNGEVLLCRNCKQRPRAYTDKYVRDRCHECQREYLNNYNDRRRPNSQAAKSRNH